MLSFDPKAGVITTCKEYLFNRPEPIELRLTKVGDDMNLLRSSGFKESYILGLDKAREHLRLARKLRTDSIDPWKTHIEEFAALVKPHLDYIERGIRSQDSADKLERLAILENFRAETQSWLEKKEVSYRRWVNLNFRLSILATPKDKRATEYLSDDFASELHTSEAWVTNEQLESAYLKEIQRKQSKKSIIEMLNQFPEVIIAPQMDGLTGIMALTRMTARRVYLHALENNATDVHGFHHPDWIFRHDSGHMTIHDRHLMEWVGTHGRSYKEMILPFHNAFLLHIQELPVRKREMLELIYHYMVFERPTYAYVLSNRRKNSRYPVTSLLRFDIGELSSLLYYLHKDTQIPDWVKPNNIDDVKAFLTKEAMNIYDDTAQEVFNSL